MLLPELLIKLPELIVGRDVFGIGISDGFELPHCFIILPQLDVFQRQRIPQEGIVWIVFKKAF